MERNIVVFTNSSSLKSGKRWFFDELKILKSEFKVRVYCFDSKYTERIEDFEVHSLNQEREYKLRYVSLFWSCFFGESIREFFKEKVFLKIYWCKSWIYVLKQIQFLSSTSVLHELQQYDRQKTLIYFYWGNNAIYLAPVLRRVGFRNIVSRFHGYDLYKERMGGYQPFKSVVLKSLSVALPISEQGKEYLFKHYLGVMPKSHVAYLGTEPISAKAIQFLDEKISIVSCSSIIELKQVHVIAKALSQTTIPLKWTHIGDGPLMHLIHEVLSDNRNSLLEVCLTGNLEPHDIRNLYLSESFHLFINASTTEGIPVSIMEAFAASIPAIAPRVGGIEELVEDGKNGFLLPESWTDKELLQMVNQYAELSHSQRQTLSENAFLKYKECFDIEKNTERLQKFFLRLLKEKESL